MPTFGKSLAIQLDSIVFATDFSPASQNAGLYASAVSLRFGTSLIVAHAFTLTQAALEVEAEKPGGSIQRANLKRNGPPAGLSVPRDPGICANQEAGTYHFGYARQRLARPICSWFHRGTSPSSLHWIYAYHRSER
jgi:hypothetical protein